MNTPELEALRAFRQQVYTLFGCRRDALFEILDAVLSAPSLETPAHLSLPPTCQRGWGSLYDALNAGTMDLTCLERLVASSPLEPQTAWYAVDASVWPRCDAETSPERGYYHHPYRQSPGQPMAGGLELLLARPAPPALLELDRAARVGPRRCGSVGSSLARIAIWLLQSKSVPGWAKPRPRPHCPFSRLTQAMIPSS